MAVPNLRADESTRVRQPFGRCTLGTKAGLLQVSLALVVVIAFSACGGTASTTPPLRADAIAVVGDIQIARHQLDVLMKAKATAIAVATGVAPKAGSPQYRQQQDGLVSLLVGVAEARQEAQQLGIRVAPSRVDAATRQLEQKFGEPLARRGLTKAELRLTAEVRTLSRAIAARVGARTQVTASEVARYYRTHLATYLSSPSRTLALILVRSQALAIRLGHELDAGAAIAPLARRYSLDRTSAKDGGKLTTTASTLTRPLSKVAFGLKTGAVSAPTQTAFGWAIVKALTPIHPARTAPLKRVRAQIHHDLLESERTQQTATWFGEQTTRYCRSGLTFRRGFMPAGLCSGTRN
jgi:parvulin-like peptidyl-prolyl isomerase